MRTEKDLQTYLRREAIKAGATFDKLESRSRQGFPDVMLAAGGRVWFIELKSPSGTGRLGPAQKRVIADLRAHGVDVFICDSVRSVDEVINMVKGFA